MSRLLAALLVMITAAAASPPTLKPVVGFGGVARDGATAPLRVEVTANDEAARGWVEAPTGPSVERGGELLTSVWRAPVDVPAGGAKTYLLSPWLVHPFGLSVRFVDRYGHRTETPAKLSLVDRAARLVVVVSPTRAGLRFLRRPAADPDPATEVANVGAEELPPHPEELEGVDAMVVSGNELVAQPEAVRQALAAWVRAGGHLVLVGGSASAGLWQAPEVGRLSPVREAGLAAFGPAELAPLAARFGPLGAPGARYAATSATLARGEALLGPPSRPLVATTPEGLGRVSFLALAFDQPPLAGWAGQPALWRWLLALPTRRPWLGFAPPEELARLAGDNHGNRRGPVVSWVGGFLLVYLVVLIPLQLLVLRRLGRRELTWVVTPLLALAFAGAARGLSVVLAGRPPAVRTVSAVAAVSGHVEGAVAETAAVLATAANRRVTLTVPGGQVQALGGEGPVWQNPLAEPAPLICERGPQDELRVDLPVPVGRFRGVGCRTAPVLPGPVTVTVAVDGRTARVSNGLSRPLESPHLTWGGRLYALGGAVAPGGTVDVPLRGGQPAGAVSLRRALGAVRLSRFGDLRHVPINGGEVRGAHHLGEDPRLIEPALWAWVEQTGPVLGTAGGPQLWLLRVELARG